MENFKQLANASTVSEDAATDPLAGRRAVASSGQSLKDVFLQSNPAALHPIGSAVGADKRMIIGAAPESALDRAIKRLVMQHDQSHD
jgi:hypothetical protein